jgi:aminoglycoside phosphotransferase (APT) family kinase protein
MATNPPAAETPSTERPRTTTRDPEDLRQRLEAWLATKLPSGAEPRIAEVRTPSSNGMSSETLLFDAAWREAGAARRESLVARLAPEPSAVPVFPEYDLERQFRVMQLVGQLTDVPVPRVLWSESDAAHLGGPFFVMQRASGVVPPDVMPYNFGDSWVFAASEEERARLERATVSVLARLHSIRDAATTFAFLGAPGAGRSALRRHVDGQRAYYEWVVGDRRGPLLERCFAWLEEHWPAEEGPTALSWGDARIGNVMYQDFAPVAVLDWEMAALAPPEVDLAWLIFLHRFFEDLAVSFGLTGLPGFLRRDNVAAHYAELTGYTPRDLDFYTMYAALRHGIVMTRVQLRAIHFGEAQMPESYDDLVMHKATLEAMLAGTYWDGVR